MSNTSKKNLPERDYEVGYGKPPVSSQWKRGQSGNPKGSSGAEAIDIAKCAGRALRRRVSIAVDGKPRTMSVREAMIHKLTVDAAMGVPSARRELFKLINLFETLNRSTGWTVIDARPVLEDEAHEQTRLSAIAEENERLRERVKELEARLGQCGDQRSK